MLYDIQNTYMPFLSNNRKPASWNHPKVGEQIYIFLGTFDKLNSCFD